MSPPRDTLPIAKHLHRPMLREPIGPAGPEGTYIRGLRSADRRLRRRQGPAWPAALRTQRWWWRGPGPAGTPARGDFRVLSDPGRQQPSCDLFSSPQLALNLLRQESTTINSGVAIAFPQRDRRGPTRSFSADGLCPTPGCGGKRAAGAHGQFGTLPRSGSPPPAASRRTPVDPEGQDGRPGGGRQRPCDDGQVAPYQPRVLASSEQARICF